MFKLMKPGRRYFLINIDEPYANEIYKALKRGQQLKGEWPEGDIDFTEWKRQTFGCLECPDYRYTRSGGGSMCVAILPDKGIAAGKFLVEEAEGDRGLLVLVKPPAGWACPRGCCGAEEVETRRHSRSLPLDKPGVTRFDQAGREVEEEFIPAEVTRNILLLVGEEIDMAVIETWTQEQRQQAIDWAGAWHLYASDNLDVVVPPKPEFFSGNARNHKPPTAAGMRECNSDD